MLIRLSSGVALAAVLGASAPAIVPAYSVAPPTTVAGASPSASPSPSAPAPAPATAVKPTVVFNHRDARYPLVHRVPARANEQITLLVTNTCPDAFDYGVEGVMEADPGSATRKKTGVMCDEKQLSDFSVSWTHDDRFGGYLVRITKSDPEAAAENQRLEALVAMSRNQPDVALRDFGQLVFSLPSPSPAPSPSPVTPSASPAAGSDAKVFLSEVTLVIHVDEPKGFATSYGAGFLGSDLTDPIFAIGKETTGGVERTMLRENPDARDEYRLGVGSFIHAYHEKYPHLAASFGLGVNDPNRVTYFGGLTVRAPGVGALTIGPTWGPTRRLPDALRLDTEVPAGTSLNDLPLRTRRGWFLAVSFEFLSKPEDIQKPFASAFAPKETKK